MSLISSSSADGIDTKIEALCAVILKTDTEEWEKRNNALNSIRQLIADCKDTDSRRLSELSMHNIFRALKEPIKSMISDLRSQQVRDTCALLSVMVETFSERIKLFLRDTFFTILEGIKVPNKVMSGYVDDCIMYLIANATFKSAIPLIAAEISNSKAKQVKERCMEYIIEILVHWDLSDRELDMFVKAIKAGLEDGSNDTREKAKVAYINIYHLFPEKALAVKDSLPRVQQNRLTKAEEEDEMHFQMAQSSGSGHSKSDGDDDIIPLNLASSADSFGNAVDDSSLLSLIDDSSEPVLRGGLTNSEKHMLASTLPTGSSFSLVGNNDKHTNANAKQLQKAITDGKSDRLAKTTDFTGSSITASTQKSTRSASVALTPSAASKIAASGNSVQRGGTGHSSSTAINSTTTTTAATPAVAGSSRSLMKPTASSLRRQQTVSDASSSRTETESVESGASFRLNSTTNKKPAVNGTTAQSVNTTAVAASNKTLSSQQSQANKSVPSHSATTTAAPEATVEHKKALVRQTLLNRRKSVVSNPFATILVTSPLTSSGSAAGASVATAESPSKLQRHNSVSALSSRTAAYRLAASGSTPTTTPHRTQSSSNVFAGAVAGSSLSKSAAGNRHSFGGRGSEFAGSPSSKKENSNPTSPLRNSLDLRRKGEQTTTSSPTLQAITENGFVGSMSKPAAATDPPFRRHEKVPMSPTVAAASAIFGGGSSSGFKKVATPASRTMTDVHTPRTASRSELLQHKQQASAFTFSESHIDNSMSNDLASAAAVETPTLARKNSMYPKHLSIGLTVKVTSEGNVPLPGIIRFIGHTHFASGIWVGVDLIAEMGKNDGSIDGRSYFCCAPMHGLFVREMHVTIPQMMLDAIAAEATNQQAMMPPLSPRQQQQVNNNSALMHSDIPQGVTAPVDGGDAMSLDTSITAGTLLSTSDFADKATSHASQLQEQQQQIMTNISTGAVASNVHEGAHCSKVHDMLKLKLSQMMELLNLQIEILNDLDREEIKRRTKEEDVEQIARLHSEVLTLTTQEADLIASFKKRFVQLQSGSSGPDT